jgi:hypothetical protein
MALVGTDRVTKGNAASLSLMSGAFLPNVKVDTIRVFPIEPSRFSSVVSLNRDCCTKFVFQVAVLHTHNACIVLLLFLNVMTASCNSTIGAVEAIEVHHPRTGIRVIVLI